MICILSDSRGLCNAGGVFNRVSSTRAAVRIPLATELGFPNLQRLALARSAAPDSNSSTRPRSSWVSSAVRAGRISLAFGLELQAQATSHRHREQAGTLSEGWASV